MARAEVKQFPVNVEMGSIVVFGLDEAGKAHASRFGAGECDQAVKAAALMNMQVMKVEAPVQADLASQVPQGRLFGSGKAFTPFIAKALYDRLRAVQGPFGVLSSIGRADAAAGTEGGALDGAEAAPPAGEKNANSSAAEPAGSQVSEEVGAHHPGAWDEIVEGSLVLAREKAAEGWFEAVVTDTKPDDLFIMRWRDWPDQPTFVRRREHLALVREG